MGWSCVDDSVLASRAGDDVQVDAKALVWKLLEVLENSERKRIIDGRRSARECLSVRQSIKIGWPPAEVFRSLRGGLLGIEIQAGRRDVVGPLELYQVESYPLRV